MAQLRLIAIALAALAGCRASEAGPTSGLVAPNGWRPSPELAAAARDAAMQAKITVDGVEAWSEPARGCYGAWLALRGDAGAPDAIAEQMITSLSAEPTLAGITVTEVVKPVAGADAGVLSLAFARPPNRGKLRAQLARSGAHAVLACFWNVREPVACEASCAQLIGGMR